MDIATMLQQMQHQGNQPLVKDLMPLHDFNESQDFINRLGNVLNYPFKRLDCGCLYLDIVDAQGNQTWIYISVCPVCALKEIIHEHRSLFVL